MSVVRLHVLGSLAASVRPVGHDPGERALAGMQNKLGGCENKTWRTHLDAKGSVPAEGVFSLWRPLKWVTEILNIDIV